MSTRVIRAREEGASGEILHRKKIRLSDTINRCRCWYPLHYTITEGTFQNTRYKVPGVILALEGKNDDVLQGARPLRVGCHY